MPTDALAPQIQKMFDFEARCSALIGQELQTAKRGVEQLGLAALVAPYERAVEIFCHLAAARRLWLHRIAPSLSEFPTDGVFPVWPLEQATKESQELDALWAQYLADLAQKDLAAIVSYKSTEGKAFESTLADILLHVVNHGTCHRGQIALLVAQTGTRPVATDYIVLTRRSV